MHFKQNRIRLFVFFIFILLLIQACSKREEISDDDYFGTKVMILGHRGMGEMYRFPGNTLQAIMPALAIGTDGCEVDVQITKDTVLVLYHNLLLDSRTTCSGRVYESNWAELQQCQYNAIQNGIYVNSVDSVFRKIPGLTNLYFSFDCTKVDTAIDDQDHYRGQLLRAIQRICEKYHMCNNVFLEGYGDLLDKAQSLGMTNKLFIFGNLDENTINFAAERHYCGVSTSIDALNVDTELAHQKGLYVMTWSPDNYAENKKALRRNVDIIQTDDPISILKLLKRYNYEYIIP